MRGHKKGCGETPEKPERQKIMIGNSRNNGGVAGFSDRTKTTPISIQRTTRPMMHRTLTSMNAGLMTPIAAIPLLREDSVTRARFRLSFEMSETVEMLMNAVNVRCMAYLVPKLAFERYDGLDSLNRSYEKQPAPGGGATVPWFSSQAAPAAGSNPILLAMGVHAKPGAQINTDYVEAYNAIWNFRAKNRSPDIPLRTNLETTLAPAFWLHQTFAHIVPDFDQAIIDGEVPLNVVAGALPVRGIGIGTAQPASTSKAFGVWQTGDKAGSASYFEEGYVGSGVKVPDTQGEAQIIVRRASNVGTSPIPAIFAEMETNGITVSLSNIELARKTQAFAALRRQYNGHSDEWLIDLLMDGIQIPDMAWKQPMLLADESTVFGMAKRYATDGASLTDHVVQGATFVDMSFSIPRVSTGGVVMIVCEVTPEQLFERQKDPYLHATTVDVLPQFLRDTLDPEKVQVVTNDEVDVDHDSPSATFGYAPLNHSWMKSIPRVGGKFFRPEVDGAFDEDRQRIWAVETKNPTLSKDFYLCTTMNYKPFVVTDANVDHFECLLSGEVSISGNTVFGGMLVEATNDYAEVLEEAPQDRIEKPATADTEAPSQTPAAAK